MCNNYSIGDSTGECTNISTKSMRPNCDVTRLQTVQAKPHKKAKKFPQTFHCFLYTDLWLGWRSEAPECRVSAPAPVRRRVRKYPLLLSRDKLHVFDRHLCLAAWSQPSEINRPCDRRSVSDAITLAYPNMIPRHRCSRQGHRCRRARHQRCRDSAC